MNPRSLIRLACVVHGAIEKKLGHVGSIRKFWRRYHLTKIVIILGLSSGLLVEPTYLR